MQKIDRREFFRSEKCSFAAKEAGSEAGSPGLAPAEASTESALMGNLFSRAYAKFSFSAASGMNKVEGEKGTAERVQGKYEMKTKKTLKSMEKFGKTSKKYAQKAYRKVSKLTKKLEKEIKKRYKNFEKITKVGSKNNIICRRKIPIINYA